MSVRIKLKVTPKASRDRVVGWMGDRLKVAVTAPPERRKANAAVVEVVARALGIAPARVRIVGGETSPLKTVEIDLPGEAEVRRRLQVGGRA